MMRTFILAAAVALGVVAMRNDLGLLFAGTIIMGIAVICYPGFDVLSSDRRKWRRYWKAQHAKENSQLRPILAEIELVRDQNKKAPGWIFLGWVGALVWSVTATRRIESDEGEFVDLRSPQARRTELYAGLVVLAIVVAIGGALFITASSIGLGEMIVDMLGWMIIGIILVIAGSPLFDMLSVRRKRRACKNDPTKRWLAYWEAQRIKQISQLRLILTEIELENKKAPATDRGSD